MSIIIVFCTCLPICVQNRLITNVLQSFLSDGLKRQFLMSCLQIKPEDIIWQGEDPGLYQGGRGAPGSGGKKSTSRGMPTPGTGRGRGFQKHVSKKDFPRSQNGVGKRSSDDIDILHTESLIKEVSFKEVFASLSDDDVLNL